MCMASIKEEQVTVRNKWIRNKVVEALLNLLCIVQV